MKQAVLHGLVFLAAIYGGVGSAEEAPNCSGNSRTQIEANGCQEGKLERTEARLNESYVRIIRMLDAGPKDPLASYFIDKKKDLIASERAWVKYRDAQCRFFITMNGAGSGIPELMGQCLAKAAEERIMFLEQTAKQIASESKLCGDGSMDCKAGR